MIKKLTLKTVLICSKLQLNNIYVKIGAFVGKVDNVGNCKDYQEKLNEELKGDLNVELWSYEPLQMLMKCNISLQQMKCPGFQLLREDVNFKIYLQIIAQKIKKRKTISLKENQFGQANKKQELSVVYQSLKQQIHQNLSRFTSSKKSMKEAKNITNHKSFNLLQKVNMASKNRYYTQMDINMDAWKSYYGSIVQDSNIL